MVVSEGPPLPEGILKSLVEKRKEGVHNWPTNDECKWSAWKTAKGLPNSTQYRNCLSEECKKVEYRDTPKG